MPSDPKHGQEHRLNRQQPHGHAQARLSNVEPLLGPGTKIIIGREFEPQKDCNGEPNQARQGRKILENETEGATNDETDDATDGEASDEGDDQPAGDDDSESEAEDDDAPDAEDGADADAAETNTNAGDGEAPDEGDDKDPEKE